MSVYEDIKTGLEQAIEYEKDNKKEKVLKSLEACSEFCCGECAYQWLDNKEFSLRCIRSLLRDAYELLKED